MDELIKLALMDRPHFRLFVLLPGSETAIERSFACVADYKFQIHSGELKLGYDDRVCEENFVLNPEVKVI